MKRHLFLFVSFLLTMQWGWACGPYDRLYLAEDYFTYRACGDNMTGLHELDRQGAIRKKANCEAWQKLTSRRIPLADIEQVVYKWSIDSIRQLQVESSSRSDSDNRFAQWIVRHQDREILDFLIVAKTCEAVRASQLTEWYYPVEGDSYDVALTDVIEKAEAYSRKRLKDRYVLQAVRAYFAKRDYSTLLNYWYAVGEKLPAGVLKEMCIDYVAGALIRTGEEAKVKPLYLEQGLAYSASLYEKDPDKRFELIYQYTPDDTWLITEMQRRIHKMELDFKSRWAKSESRFKSECQTLYPLVRRICSEKRCRDMAPWYYTCAYLLNGQGKTDQAWTYIKKAEKAAKNQELQEAIRVLRIMLWVKQTPQYDIQFENQFFHELQWMDQQVVTHLDSSAREKIKTEGSGNHITGLSQYYWNDMMRKVLISQIAPLCIRSDYQTRALEYLNMADNRIFQLVDQREIIEWDKQFNAHPKQLSWTDYRNSSVYENRYDYSTDLFINLDSIGVRHIKRMVWRMSDANQTNR